MLMALTVALSVGVATASAGGGNSANAKLCQHGGWINLQGSDGTQFVNQGECVSFGAHGGMIVPKPTCTAGNENFSEDAGGSRPTTFVGGTIDTAFSNLGWIRIQGDPQPNNWDGAFPTGTHVLFTGTSSPSFQLSFTKAVSSVQLDAESLGFAVFTLTLTAYDSSDTVVDTDAKTQTGVASLSVTSAMNNIQYFTIGTTSTGLAFSNIVWDCA
jgi:hypothetical protein